MSKSLPRPPTDPIASQNDFIASLISGIKPKHIRIPLNLDNLALNVNGCLRDNNRVLLRAYLVNASKDCRVDGMGSHQKICQCTREEISNCLNFLVNLATDEYRKLHKQWQQTTRPEKKNGIFSSALRSDDECGAKSDFNLNWAKSTFQKTWAYLRDSVLPRMDQFGLDINDAALESIRLELVDKAAANKRGSRLHQNAERSVADSLNRIDRMLEVLFERHPELPQCYFHARRPTRITPEQAKALPEDVRTKLAHALTQLICAGPAMGVAAMFLMGLRSGEAAALDIEELEEHIDYVELAVTHQLTLSGERTPILKSRAAYRYAIGAYLMHNILTSRKEYLKNIGFDELSIKKMPFVSTLKDPTKRASRAELSDYAKALLLECGCTASYLRSAQHLMDLEPDYDPLGNKEDSVSAYVLRRDWISRAANVCGMPSSVIDHHIGHKSRKLNGKDFSNPATQQLSAMMMERHVLLPSHTRHPYYYVHELCSSSEIELDDFGNYRYKAKEPILVYLNLTSNESGEPITVRTNGKIVDEFKIRRSRRDSPEQRMNRPIIGEIQSQDFFEKASQEALYLTPFLPPTDSD